MINKTNNKKKKKKNAVQFSSVDFTSAQFNSMQLISLSECLPTANPYDRQAPIII
jgi:hypothetical protein